ncbi:conserved membrane hypothetical protein [Planktothrix serta PCC 8927]|uniref:Uncharacterized protein n=1 Tax=Planktothrix serta PCC 8927 TaxID=671068 RepID=A0A7Z9C1X8_9CYAN|nr:hypothetical protein [Planktothrix serta]VXD25602.1 conserved membrane hypothetical protein [Planktothrix serta PCC 8927]
MTPKTTPKKTRKSTLINEFMSLAIVNLYLALSFSVLITLNSLALLKHGIDAFNYGMAIIGALIVGKVIVLCEKLPLVERYGDKPLIISSVYKSILFTIIVLIINVAEHFIIGLFQQESIAKILIELKDHFFRIDTIYQIFCLFLVFLPFFITRELDQVLGKGSLFNLFFKSRTLNPN